MQKQLIHQFIGLQFTYQGLFIQNTCLVKCKSRIDLIICYRTIYKIVIMCKTRYIAVFINKIHPFLGRAFKPKGI